MPAGCPAVISTDEFAECDGGKFSCATGLSCAADSLGLACEYACSTTADCPDLETVCANGHCLVNQCGAGSNGTYDGPCSAAGSNDGICVPIDTSGDGGSATYGLCLQSGTATSLCSTQSRCDPTQVCQPGWFCNATSAGSSTGTCLQLCDPSSAIGVCPTGQGCQATSSDLGSCVVSKGPCNGVPTTGLCLSSSQVELCVVPTGSATPTVETYDCTAGTACVAGDGGAQCELTGACLDGATQCLSSTEREICLSGNWQETPCASGCIASPVGSSCAPALTLAPISLTFQYEFQGIDSATTPTGWSAVVSDAPAQGFLVLSYAGVQQDLVDAQMTDGTGTVKLNVASAPSGADFIALVAAAGVTRNGQLTVQYAVANPGFPSAGEQDTGTAAPNPAIWSWSVPAAGLTSGQTLTIQVANGSGAARDFDNVRRAHDYAASEEGDAGGSMVAWLGFGTSWNCGSCFGAVPVSFAGLNFQDQTWYGGATADKRWWADPVTVHEQGHWTMSSYGTLPSEGGTHEIGVATFPGLAWAEGWATWFSSDVRADPVYYDQQNGTFFWFNIAEEFYDESSHGNPEWYLPSPAGGLSQLIDENQVSHMLWSLSTSDAGGDAGADAKLFTALASPHMNTSPWPEGYTRHTFELDQEGCDPAFPMSCYADVVNTGVPVPFLADFLDALDCAGAFSHATIDAATVPNNQYPYFSPAPRCQPSSAARPQLQASWVTHDLQPGQVALTAHVQVFSPFPAPMKVKFTVPAGASVDGPTEFELPPPGFAATVDRDLTVSYGTIPEQDLVLTVDVKTRSFGMHAEDVYRFGRPAPTVVLPKATGPHLRIGAVDLGPSVPLRTQ